MKIALVCSHGGHLTESLQIMDAFDGHEVFFCTYSSVRDGMVKRIAPAYFTENIGYSFWKMIKAFWEAWKILRKERPDVILSLGAEIAVPYLYLGKLMGLHTIFIESWCRVSTRSLTGRLVYPIVDAYWVQWPEQLDICGLKAEYKGAVI